jgi:sulfate adenylyltransferase subunit 2
MDRLDVLENRSIYIIREAWRSFRDIAVLWSMGKDSTVLIHLCRKAFFGRIPFPVMHIDTGFKFREMYGFRDKHAKLWDLDLRVVRSRNAGGVCPENGRFECCSRLKTDALRQAIIESGLRAVLLGIRRDEHGIRAKERYFSPRNEDFEWEYEDQPPELWNQFRTVSADGTHTRVHPMLHWGEKDVWRYVQRENLPVVNLYFAGSKVKGKRYRSIGCEPCCSPVGSSADTIEKIVREMESTGIAERSGRWQDKENLFNMQKLRSLGYM